MSAKNPESGYRRKPQPDLRVRKAFQKRLYKLAYDVLDLRKRYAGRWRRSFALLGVQSFLVLMPNLIIHPQLTRRSIGLLVLAVLAANTFLRLEVNAIQSQKINESKNDRKIRTAGIIDKLSLMFPKISMSQSELRQLRNEILHAITSSVASSLGMEAGGFMGSLLIRTPSALDQTLTVIARSDPSREIGIVYPKEGMLAWEAIERGQVQITGDVTEEFDGFDSKPYNSVISFPIMVAGNTIAAVYVDQAFRYLFLDRGLLFQTNLRPYLRLIALSLDNVAETQPEPKPGVEA